MQIAKKTIISKLAVYSTRAALWKSPFAFFGILLMKFAREKYASRKKEFFGVPVYFIEFNDDFSKVWDWLENSVTFLSPFWTKQLKKSFKCIMIQGTGPIITYDQMSRCWMINALKLRILRGRKPIIMLTENLVLALCIEFLSQGRFGNFGIQNMRLITYSAMVRALRKCDVNGDCYDDIELYYQKIDQYRPGRNYRKRFIIEKQLNSTRQP